MIHRIIAVSMFVLVFSAVRAGLPFEMNRGISGSWYNPAQDGHGFSIEYLDDQTLLVYWYMYTPQGDSAFLVGVGTIQGNQVTIPMQYTDGMVFGQFDPATNMRFDWGTVTISFTSCTSGSVSYQSTLSVDDMPFGSGSFPISRLAFVQDLGCDVADLGRHLPRSPIAGFYEGSVDDIDDAVGVIFESGEAWFIAPEFGLLRGTINHVDGVAEGVLTIKTDDGLVLGQVEIDGTFSRRDWFTGTYDGLGGGTFSMAYRSSYERDSSVQAYAGRYGDSDPDGYSITLDIDTNGQISGSDTDSCEFSGRISLIDSQFNPVNLELTVSVCEDIAGEYQGVLALADFEAAGDGRTLYIAADNDQSALLGSLVKESGP